MEEDREWSLWSRRLSSRSHKQIGSSSRSDFAWKLLKTSIFSFLRLLVLLAIGVTMPTHLIVKERDPVEPIIDDQGVPSLPGTLSWKERCAS